MTRGLHILGAAGDGLRGQTVTARVESVDVPKFKARLKELAPETAGHDGAIDLAFKIADWKPEAVIDAAIPLIRKELAGLGIDATITAGAAPTRGQSEFWGGLAVGGVLGGSALVIVKLIGRLF